MNCENCFHKKVCLRQYGDQVTKWALQNGCKNFADKETIIVLPLPATQELYEELNNHCFNRCVEEL